MLDPADRQGAVAGRHLRRCRYLTMNPIGVSYGEVIQSDKNDPFLRQVVGSFISYLPGGICRSQGDSGNLKRSRSRGSLGTHQSDAHPLN
jgi:hypothetical protein